jgi:hypothetical protein
MLTRLARNARGELGSLSGSAEMRPWMGKRVFRLHRVRGVVY